MPGPEFSIWALFMRADIVVKLVIIGLMMASIWSWAIILDKALRLRRLGRAADKFEDVFWSGMPLEDLVHQIGGRPATPMESVFAAAMREWRRSTEKGPLYHGLQERIDRIMTVTISRELGRVEGQLGFLATVGSTAPFVGLFGTVWGIMNTLQAIGVNKATTLAVVAPGIAEALFATALGLLAAIPAVVAYNRFSSQVGRYAGRLEGFADEFAAILSRQVDERVRGEGADRGQ
ncbi:MAG: protein TolQ [Alphaproteobacteria bacterium]